MADINEYYERYWESPEQYNDPTAPMRIALVHKHLSALPKGASIIDVGCGTGEFCAVFKEMGLSPQGIDISNHAIDFARRKHPGIPFHAGEVQTLLPEHAGAFDCVFSSEVIEHLFDVEGYLRTINQLLKPGGTYVVTTPYHGLLKNVMIDLMNYRGHYDPLGQHIRFFDTKGLRYCLEKFGFEPKKWTGYGRPWPFWKSFFVVNQKVKAV